MPPKSNMTSDLIIALQDSRFLDALGSIIEAKLHPWLETLTELKADNPKKSAEISQLQNDLQAATSRIAALETAAAASRIEALETYTRRDNLLITGLPIDSYAEAGVTNTNAEAAPSQSVEQSVLKVFNEKLGVPITSADISVAHRLKKRNPTDSRPPVTIVRFTNRKAREAVYGARRQLKNDRSARIFINEDLNKSTADLFHKARQLVRQRLLHSTWTSSCAVYVKDTGDPNCRPRKVSSLGDLPRGSNG